MSASSGKRILGPLALVGVSGLMLIGCQGGETKRSGGAPAGGPAAAAISGPATIGKGWNLVTTEQIAKDVSGRAQDLYDVVFQDAKKGWAVGSLGTVVASTDGGIGWVPQKSGVELFNLHSVELQGPDKLRTTGVQGVMRATTDGGITPWVEAPSPAFVRRNHLYDMRFVDEKNGCAAGDNALLMCTKDGGATWAGVATGASQTLSGLAYVSPSEGWVVGKVGVVIHTKDGGSTWEAQDNPAKQSAVSLEKVFFVNAQAGWAIGGAGTVIATTDGGKTWVEQTTNTLETLRGLYFLNTKVGWVVGDKGAILVTADGGATWKPQESGTTQNLRSVFFLDAKSGWVVGNAGTILKFAE